MRFVVFGYFDEERWNGLPEAEQQAFFDRCFAYDDELRANGHFTGGEALDSSANTRSVRSRNGKVQVTDGPYVEAKEVVGGFLILEARDLEHAVELVSKHPGATTGGFEIRPIVDMTPLFEASARRRAAAEAS